MEKIEDFTTEINNKLLRIEIARILHFDIAQKDFEALGFSKSLQNFGAEEKGAIALLHILSKQYQTLFADEYKKACKTTRRKFEEKKQKQRKRNPLASFFDTLDAIMPGHYNPRRSVLTVAIPKILTDEKYKSLRETTLAQLQTFLHEIAASFKDFTPIMRYTAEEAHGIDKINTNSLFEKISDPKYLRPLLKIYLEVIYPQELK